MQRRIRIVLLIVSVSAVIALAVGIVALVIEDMRVVDSIDERCLEHYGYNDAENQAERDAARQAAHEACGTDL
jgi:hypothetical protein